uniref:Uncharacterized protein n=1 Tax=Paramormyrops kingsleyae TaxID=1676925 RepID=A0A3B3T4A2_9TELE
MPAPYCSPAPSLRLSVSNLLILPVSRPLRLCFSRFVLDSLSTWIRSASSNLFVSPANTLASAVWRHNCAVVENFTTHHSTSHHLHAGGLLGYTSHHLHAGGLLGYTSHHLHAGGLLGYTSHHLHAGGLLGYTSHHLHAGGLHKLTAELYCTPRRDRH